ncbi:AAA family ATPase [Candidatus Woesearchaeota archaeon]|nr:AAA family ATPase [Candidatus Woesearchaeota archaeon]
MTKNIIIGITGTLGAGKGTIVEHLKQLGFKHYSVRNYLIDEIKRRNLEINRDNMVLVANDLRSKYGSSFIVEELYKIAKTQGNNSIIESLRTPGEVESLQKEDGFVLFSVDADKKTRYDRICLRQSESDNVSFEKFCAQEELEMTSTDPAKQNISKCMEMADYHFTNNKTIPELFENVDIVLDLIKDNA